MKFCKDCKYCENLVWCKRPTGEINYVSEEPITTNNSCQYERSPQEFHFLKLFSRKKCGPKGIFWEEKEETERIF